MIVVKFDMSKDGKSLLFSVKGHAGLAEKGHDIVCAAASMLAFTLGAAVADLYAGEKLKQQPEIYMEAGAASVNCKPHRSHFDEAYKAYNIIQTGYQILSERYPEYVKIILLDRV